LFVPIELGLVSHVNCKFHIITIQGSSTYKLHQKQQRFVCRDVVRFNLPGLLCSSIELRLLDSGRLN